MFCFLNPGGKEITRAGRGPNQQFRDASDMAKYMKQVAAKYQANDSATPALPKLKDVRLALNVAECDGQPLVVAFGDAAALSKLDVRLAQAAFSKELRGRFVFATTSDAGELDGIGLQATRDASIQPGIYAIDPDTFGLKGTRLAQLPLDSSLEEIVKQLGEVAATQNRKSKSHRQHVQAGNRKNVKWETEIPVTDPGSLRAVERGESSGIRRRRK